MNKPWKFFLLLAGIFLAGVVAGGCLTMRFGRHFLPRRPSLEQQGPDRLKLLTEKLNLTPEQQEKLRPILHRDMQDLARIRNSSMTESRRIFEHMDQDVAAELTPEQKPKFDEMIRERRDRFQRFLREHPPGTRERPPGGPAGPLEEPPGPPPPPDAPKNVPSGGT